MGFSDLNKEEMVIANTDRYIISWWCICVTFKMAADHMFYQPTKVLMVNAAENKVDSGRLVIGVKINDEAKAYPIRF